MLFPSLRQFKSYAGNQDMDIGTEVVCLLKLGAQDEVAWKIMGTFVNAEDKTVVAAEFLLVARYDEASPHYYGIYDPGDSLAASCEETGRAVTGAKGAELAVGVPTTHVVTRKVGFTLLLSGNNWSTENIKAMRI